MVVWDEPDYGGAGYPDSWWTEFPGEGCEPWELCVLGPDGGVSVPDNQCTLKLAPNALSSAPAYCLDPCNTSNELIDTPAIQMIMEKLATESGFHLQSIGDRLEQGGWITQKNGVYEFVPFPADWTRYPCGIAMPENHLDYVPKNVKIIAVIHTHPFKEGDDTTNSSVCGSGGSTNYESSHSYEDWQYLYDVANYVGDYSILGIVFDIDNIVIFNAVTGMYQYVEKFEISGI